LWSTAALRTVDARRETDVDKAPPNAFTVSSSIEGGGALIVLAGELDLASAPLLQAAVADALAQPIRELRLDLGRLTFVDSMGVRAILEAHRLAGEAGIWFALHNATHEAVSRVFALLRLGRHVGIE
jgi:anti-anti-sigma factor